jgi:hypothetical protein
MSETDFGGNESETVAGHCFNVYANFLSLKAGICVGLRRVMGWLARLQIAKLLFQPATRRRTRKIPAATISKIAPALPART